MTGTQALYTDGGVIQVNPSPFGGTWAWTVVEHGQRIRQDSGVLLPTADYPAITNNVTELYALVAGIESLPVDWVGIVFSDSWVSLQRLFLGAKLKNVPEWLVERLQVIRQSGRLSQMAYVLLDGHPTQAQLLAGKGKRGGPVSEFNVWCDEECGRVGRAAGLGVRLATAQLLARLTIPRRNRLTQKFADLAIERSNIFCSEQLNRRV